MLTVLTIGLFSEAVRSEEEREARVQSPDNASDLDDDISVGDNCSETSTKKTHYYDAENYQKKSEEDDRSSPIEYSSRISNSNFNSPFKEDEVDFESRQEDRMKLYEGSLFQLYRSERDTHKDEGGESFSHITSPLSESIYSRSMDLTKSTFQSQLLAGFAASVMAGNSQRESQEPPGIYFFHF